MNTIKKYIRNWRDHPFVVTILSSIIIGYGIRLYTETPVYTPPRYNPPARVVTPSQNEPVYDPSSVVKNSTPITPPPATDYTSTSNYRAPSSSRYTNYTFTIGDVPYRLDNEESFNHLSAMKRQAESLSVWIAATRIQCNDLSSQINRCKAELNSLSYNLDRTNQYAIDNYNSKIDTVNQYVETYRIRAAELNAKIDEYNAILDGMKSFAQLHRRF
jgi:hypothetical protein